MAEIPRIAIDEVTARLARGERVAFVDARSARAMERATEQIPGSFPVPPGDVDRRAAAIPRGAIAVAYCTCPREESSARVALRLRELGVAEAFALKGGFDAWRAGRPVEPVRRSDPAQNAVDHQPM